MAPTPEHWNVTKHRSVRVEDDLWDELGQAAALQGTDRATLIREWIRWHLRKPGARKPQQTPKL